MVSGLDSFNAPVYKYYEVNSKLVIYKCGFHNQNLVQLLFHFSHPNSIFSLYSFGLRVLAIFKPGGLILGGTQVGMDTLIGNVIFYKSLEGFLESLPQSIYQTSIVLRQGVDISKE